MSFRLVPIGVLLAEECGHGVWCVGDQVVAEAAGCALRNIEAQPSQPEAVKPDPKRVIAQRQGGLR